MFWCGPLTHCKTHCQISQVSPLGTPGALTCSNSRAAAPQVYSTRLCRLQQSRRRKYELRPLEVGCITQLRHGRAVSPTGQRCSERHSDLIRGAEIPFLSLLGSRHPFASPAGPEHLCSATCLTEHMDRPIASTPSRESGPSLRKLPLRVYFEAFESTNPGQWVEMLALPVGRGNPDFFLCLATSCMEKLRAQVEKELRRPSIGNIRGRLSPA
ncbi:hypothetical protein JOL62DRAFT_194024 [Phyllosticta paracitricarpa]|uniref:Uncharacterized protein n=1 Tax=Phyllosticta paracitricarpa TaxID=2016321 RepID=A0ABR1N4F5_9PEZI